MGTITVFNLGKAYKQYPNRWSRLLEWTTPGKGKRHSLKWVLQDISFTVNAGEAVGIIGINGAGKSTLLKLITGTTQPTTGSIHMAGRVAAMLEAVSLSGLGTRLPQQLSGGQLQRVAIARALVHRPRLLLADEPTGNLDPTTAERVMDALIAQTRAHGAALVLVTHSEAAAARADRVVRLRADGVYP